MSFLTIEPAFVRPLPPIPSPEQTVRQIDQTAARAYARRVDEWSEVINLVWDRTDTAAVLAAFGATAKARFEASTAEYVYLLTFSANSFAAADHAANAARLNEVLGKVKANTIHEDGTVTVNVIA